MPVPAGRPRHLLAGAMLALLVAGCGVEWVTPGAAPVRTGPVVPAPVVPAPADPAPVVPMPVVPPPTAPPPAAPLPAASRPAVPVPVLDGSRPERLSIPVLGVDSAVMDLGLRDDGTMEVPPDGTTTGWYSLSPTPGEIGPAVFAAHVDWKGEPGVFSRLHRLRPGDGVQVLRADGSTAVFAVRRVEQYPKDAFPSEAVYGDVGGPELRLITCGGEFDDGARSYQDNIVAYAQLTGSA